MVKGKLNSRQGGATVKLQEGTQVEGGWVTVGADDGLPVVCVMTESILPVTKELGFRGDKRGGREQEDDVLLLL